MNLENHAKDSPGCEEAAIVDGECLNCGWRYRVPLHTDECAYVERGEKCDCGLRSRETEGDAK